MELTSSLLSARRPTRRISIGGVPIGDGAPDHRAVDDDDEDRRRRRRRWRRSTRWPPPAPTSCAAPATRRRRPRGWPTSSRARRCRSWPTSTSTTRWRSPRSRPASRGSGSTRATCARRPRSSRSPPRRRDRGVPIRIGVNAGSLHPDLYKKYGGATPEALVESARNELAYFEEVGFNDVKISVKASRVAADDRRLPAGLRDLRPPAPPRRDRGGPAARRPGQGDGRDRHAARRGDRRHDPLLAHRRPGRGGTSRPPAARVARAARAQGPRPHRLPVVRARPGRRHRRGEGGPGGAREAATCRSRSP